MKFSALLFSVGVFTLVLAGAANAQTLSEVHFAETSSWSTGFTCDVTITNRQTSVINPWSLVFTWSPQITSLWNGTLVGQVNNVATVSPASWNASLAPNSSASFGFTANGIFAQTVSSAMLNGTAVTITYSTGSTGGPSNPGSSVITFSGLSNDSTSVSMSGQTPRSFSLGLTPVNSGATFTADVSNPDVVTASISGSQLILTPLGPGFSGLRIRETTTQSVRTLGLAVRTPAERMPGLPRRLALGSVSEDTANQLAFWREMSPGDQNRRMDIRYIYINGGPFTGWRTWTTVPGARVSNYIRESRRLGMIPYFVFYNVPDGGESFDTDSLHLFSSAYMTAWYQDLALFLDLIAAETRDGWPVGIILEPDLLGYMAQNNLSPTQATWSAPSGAIGSAQTQAAYQALDPAGLPVLDALVDPMFPNTLRGFVESTNYIIRKRLPEATFGWQMNLWASPPGGFTGIGIPGNGIIRKTDTSGLTLGRAQIQAEATAITTWYVAAGITTHGASLVSIDKYGLDAGAEGPTAVSNPGSSTWFWNADHWGNYLVFVEAMFQTARLPVVLWQIPVGHINSSLAVNPYQASGVFTNLSNNYQNYEDSAGSYFLGDSFTTSGARTTWFSTNAGADPQITLNGAQITWGSHLSEAAAKGVMAILFGAGVGASTHGIPPGTSSSQSPTDDFWWITQTQRVFQAGLPPLHPNADLKLNSVSPIQINPLIAGAPPVTLTLSGQGFDVSSVVYAEQTPLATTLLSPQTLLAMLPATIYSAQRRGGLSLAVKNGGRQTSSSVVLALGASSNHGVIHTSPLNPRPGTTFSLTVEDVPAGAPYSLLADLSLAAPVTGFPSLAVNLTVALSFPTIIPLSDGAGLFGPPTPTVFAPLAGTAGAAGRSGLPMPLPPLHLTVTFQAAYVDPFSPLGLGLTHPFRLDL